jgi:UDP-N-acetylglucosamine diphosphorylase/glucosamine-1-phosphate N-acetyltransferase
MKNVQIIILAAGKGTRMNSDEPKALVKLKEKPFIRHILDTLEDLHLSIKPIIVVGHKKEKIKEVLGEKYIYAEQKEQLGTGDAVLSAKNMLHKKHKIVLVLSADQPLISKETIKRIVAKHIEKKPVITIATVIVPDFKDWKMGMNNFGRIIHNADGSIEKIVEFKDANKKEKQNKEVNLALYAFDKVWLWQNIKKIKNENKKGEYYLTDLIKIAFDQKEKIEVVQVFNMIEGLQPNTKEELRILEKLIVS